MFVVDTSIPHSLHIIDSLQGLFYLFNKKIK